MIPNRSPRFSRCVPGALRLAGIAALLSFGAIAHAQSATPAAIVDRPLAPPTNDSPDDQPSPQHVWVPGHWRWGQGSYVWVAGRWELPPVVFASWVGPQWVPQGSGYVLRDGYWQQNTASQATNVTEMTAPQPPPPPRAEPIPEQPSPAYTWIPGYWEWRDNQFVWINGRWELPPRPNVSWVPARWEMRGNQYVLVSGFWRDNPVPQPVAVATPPPAPPTQVVVTQQPAPAPAPQVVVVAPPPPQQEVVYVRPSPFHVWVPGYWAWRAGRYVWIAGHWERPPHGHHDWIQPRWERRGGNYIFIEGHWR